VIAAGVVAGLIGFVVLAAAQTRQAPRLVEKPRIVGKAVVGSTLRADIGRWTGARPIRFRVQWLRCRSARAATPCRDIRGANGRTLKLTGADRGSSIHFRVTAANRSGRTKAWPRRTGIVGMPPATTTTTTTTTTAPTTTSPPPTTTTSPPSGKSVVLVNQPWYCTGPVDLDLVKVTMRDVSKHGVFLNRGCTGTIRRLEVDTWHQDAVKVGGAHDLVVESGTLTCHANDRVTHQDGVQAQSGERVTFRSLRVDCRTATNAAFFVSAVGLVPSDIVCERCTFLPANSTVNIKKSIRSGVRNSVVCRGTAHAIWIQGGAVDPVDEGNVVLSRGDPRCGRSFS
jgi:hypothetical protein